MASRLMLSRASAIALRALVELAREPERTLSTVELARRQQLPQPMLEQILLRLRRAGVVEARRGRFGGYRLALNAETLPLARVLQAVEAPPGSAVRSTSLPESGPGEGPRAAPDSSAEDSSAEDSAWSASPSPGLAGAAEADLGASAGHQVEGQLRRRLERLVQLELQRLTLAELLYDQRSWEASLGPQGGVMLS